METSTTITVEENQVTVAALSAVLASKSTEERSAHLQDRDFDVIELIVSLNQADNKIENSETAQLLFRQAQAYLHASQHGWSAQQHQQHNGEHQARNDEPSTRERARSKSKTRAASKPRPEQVPMEHAE